MVNNISDLSREELETGSVLSPRFNTDGLVTAIVQETSSSEILMLAHMNTEALSKTLETGKAHFWSRSRQELWLKGGTSGNFLTVTDILIDCDQDALLLKAHLAGNAACHTGAKSCFYRSVKIADGEVTLGLIDK